MRQSSGYERLLLMKGLPIALLQQCYDILIMCDQFENSKSLEAVFVSRELAPYRHHLPEANDKMERVQRVTNFLLYKRLVDGRSALLALLSAIQISYDKMDQRQSQLTELYRELDQALSNESAIPFVTIAMNLDEAMALVSGEAFDDEAVAPLERAKFFQLKAEVPPDQLEYLLAHYGKKRDDWKPNPQLDETIEQIVKGKTEQINQQPHRQGFSPIHPYFVSTDFFAEDDNTRWHIWDQLSWLGCVLIIDAVSLFHPKIYRRLLQSELGANERVALAIGLFSPIISDSRQANQLIQHEIIARMQRAFVRSAWYEEPLCNHEIQTPRNFSQWFERVLIDEAKMVQEQKRKMRPNPTGLNRIRDKIEVPGVSDLIFGRGGR